MKNRAGGGEVLGELGHVEGGETVLVDIFEPWLLLTVLGEEATTCAYVALLG